LFRLICIVIGYFIGCFQTSYILGRLSKNIDIREYGSGNAGMTNAVRVLGAKAGIVVFITDVLKSVAGVIICTIIFDGSFIFRTGGELGFLPALYGGLGVILGHNFPVFLKFKGGRGIAATIGLILMYDWRIIVVLFFICVPCLAISNIVSLSALLMAGFFFISAAVFGHSPEALAVIFFIAAMAFYQHRGNIGRLINKNERVLFKEAPVKMLINKLRKTS